MAYSAYSLPSFGIDQREALLPFQDRVVPCVGGAGLHVLEQFGQDGFHVADDRHVRLHHFADLRRVDVDMDDLRAGGELVHVAGHAVVETRADGNQQVGLC